MLRKGASARRCAAIDFGAVSGSHKARGSVLTCIKAGKWRGGEMGQSAADLTSSAKNTRQPRCWIWMRINGRRSHADVLRPVIRHAEHEGPLRAVSVQAGKVCNHRASPNRHLGSIPKNGFGPANMQCSDRQLRIESRLWIEKLKYQLTPASGKLQRDMRWPVKV